MKNENYVPNVDDASKVHNLVVNINNIDILTPNISDVQINFEKTIKGRIRFFDPVGTSELTALSMVLVRIKFEDAAKITFNGEFISSDVHITRNKSGGNVITIHFKDIMQHTLENTYFSKAYKDKSLIDMLEEIFNEIQVGATIIKAKYNHIHEYFVFPKNISMWEFLNKHLKYEGYTYFYDTSGLKIIPRDYLESSRLPEYKEIYSLKHQKDRPFFNILEYSGTFSNTSRVSEVAQSNKNKFDTNNLKYGFYFKGIITVEGTESLNGGYMGMGKELKLSDAYQNIGFKEIDELNYFNIIGKDEDYRDIVMDNQKLRIAIQGSNDVKKYHVLKIDVPKSKNIKKDDKDKVASGKYVVTEVINKIISGMFFQILTLQSADYPRGDVSVW
jgi:hypothetical protein